MPETTDERFSTYHRLRTSSSPNEVHDVRVSGELWGGTGNAIAGGDRRTVRAYPGPLPPGASGYTFETMVPPTRLRRHMGRLLVLWEEGHRGVEDVSNRPGYVRIKVKVVDARP